MKINIVLAALTLFVVGIGCSPKNSNTLSPIGTSSLMAPPKEGTSMIRSQLIRYRGQTEFLSTQRGVYGGRLESAVAASPQGAGAAPRAEQEADVFKVGKPGSKLLYLLNDYRGLQVVSYVDGVESPKLVGRAEPTGNYPSDMYLDPSRDRLFVLERVWFDSQDEKYNKNQSRILVYDVSKPKEPTLVEKVDVKGEIADSRMVGQALYVVSTLRPDYNSYSYYNTSKDVKGIVTSFDMSGAKVSQIQEMTLTLPAVYGTNLRVVTVPENDSYKYYLLAHLSENGWGWWGRQSLVQVVDISDDKGKISSVMTVSVKGTIQRPHQMQIKNNTLIAVSNYVVDGPASGTGQPTRQARIAVETFRFPAKDSEIITENEAELRRLYIEKQVKTETDKGASEEVSKQKWLKDNTWGVYGRFVSSKDQLRKIMPDSVVTTGDTTGLSARLQDVRIYGDWLYAFWVPANQIDPLDLFDISAPEKGVSHIQRLTFDGWISRAEPISYKGRNFVIGLGWIVPAVNNENNKRYAQVKLFEITSNGKSAKASEVASLVLNQSQFWANFSGEDKTIEFKQTTEGKGEILFEGSRVSENVNGFHSYQDGGQLIAFDLSQADTENIFKEGSFLAGESSWIKRVFTNSEINRINSFSDSKLVTFGAQSEVPSATVQAAHILELARNIKAYATLGGQGLQIINEGSAWSFDGKQTVTLRSVSKNHVDAEKTQVLNEVVIPGTYVAHMTDPEKNTLLLVTGKSTYENKKYSVSYQLHSLNIDKANKLNLVSSESWSEKEDLAFSIKLGASSAMNASRGLIPSMTPYASRDSSFFTLPGGEVVFSVGGSLKQVVLDKDVKVQEVALEQCDLNKEIIAELKGFQNQVYLLKKTPVDIKKEFKTYSRVYKHELVLLTWKNRTLTCGESINIPGDIMAFDGSHMIVSDSWVNDIYTTADQDTFNMSYGLTSLKVIKTDKGNKASLVDMMDLAMTELTYLTLPRSYSQNLSLMKYSTPTRNDYFRQSAVLEVVSLDKEAYLTRTQFHLSDSIPNGMLTKVFVDSKEPSVMYGVIKSWRKLQVIQFQAEGGARPKIHPLIPVDYKNHKQKAMNSVSLLEGYSSFEDNIHFTPDQKSIEVSSGLFGLRQFFLE